MVKDTTWRSFLGKKGHPPGEMAGGNEILEMPANVAPGEPERGKR